MDARLAQIMAWFQSLSGGEAALLGAAAMAGMAMLKAWLKKPALPELIKVGEMPGLARGLCAWLMRQWQRLLEMLDYISTRREWRYAQPWVLMLGEPHAGKSSLLHSVAASIRQAPPARAAELRMNQTAWCFFRKGALLDPDGKYPAGTPGSSEEKDWQKSLTDLNSLRPERPLDGLVLCISARTLLNASSDQRNALALDLKRQLNVLQESIEFMLPLTVVVTQCDTLSGFSAFWNNQDASRRRELFGYAAPPQLQTAAPTAWADAAFDLIDERLRVVQIEAAATRNSIANGDAFFLFPSHFQRLRQPLRKLMETVLSSSAWQPGYLFRGLFFCGSLEADGALREGVRKDVAFADSLLAMRVLAEPGLARPTRQGMFSRNSLIRTLQYTSIVAALALFVSLYFAATDVGKQVDVLISAMDHLKRSTPETVRHGDCLSAESVYPLLTDVAAINNNVRYWAIPASWLDRRATTRNDAGIETGAINAVLMPTLACRLENRARDVAATHYSLPNEKNADAYSKLKQALDTKIEDVRALEDNLARFDRLRKQGGDMSRTETLDTLATLAQYAFDAPLPPTVMEESGALSAAFGSVSADDKPVLPPRLREDIAIEIRRIASATRASLNHEVSRGASLMAELSRAENSVLDTTRRFAEWLDWVDKSWLLSTAQSNPCADQHSELRSDIEVLINRYAYPKSLWREIEQFNTEHCYNPLMQNLANLRQAPYGALFEARKPTGLQISAELRHELAGLPALVQLDFMRIRNPRRFNCQSGGEGFRHVEVAEAAAYVKQYQDFAEKQKLTGLDESKRPLYDKLARLSLAHALDDAMQRAQIATRQTPYQQVSIETVTHADQQLSAMSKELGNGIDALIGVLGSYGNFGNPGSTPLLRQCVRNFAADSLGRVSALAASSRLYVPPPSLSGDLIFDLGSVPVQKEYLARQVARAQILAGYATPFMNLLQGTQGVDDTGRAPTDTADFWRNTIDELNRYTQGKEPSGQVANLDNYFLKQLGELSYTNCGVQLARYQSPDFGNDLFSNRRHGLEPVVQLRCLNRRAAQAMETYGELAQRFNGELAGRYPFADNTAADLRIGIARQFFLDYARQRQTLGDALNVLNGDAAREARQFVAELDAVAEFFRLNLAADGDNPSPLRLQLNFNAQPGFGSEQVLSWLLTSGSGNGARSAGLPNRAAMLDWFIGEALTLDLAWANRSLSVPVADPKQADLVVEGYNARFSAPGAWGLLRLLETHGLKDNSTQSQQLLGFTVPQQRDVQHGKAERSTANLYLGITLLGNDPKTRSDVRIKLPPRFPKQAPAIH